MSDKKVAPSKTDPPKSTTITLMKHDVKVPYADGEELLSYVGRSEDLDSLLRSLLDKCNGRPERFSSRELAMARFTCNNWNVLSKKLPVLAPHLRSVIRAHVNHEQQQEEQNARLQKLAVHVCTQMVQNACISTHEKQLHNACSSLVNVTLQTPGVPERVISSLTRVRDWVLMDQPTPHGEEELVLWECIYAPIIFPFMFDGDDPDKTAQRAARRLEVLLSMFRNGMPTDD